MPIFHSFYICMLLPIDIFPIKTYTLLGLIGEIEAWEAFELESRHTSKAWEAFELVAINTTKVLFLSSLYFAVMWGFVSNILYFPKFHVFIGSFSYLYSMDLNLATIFHSLLVVSQITFLDWCTSQCHIIFLLALGSTTSY